MATIDCTYSAKPILQTENYHGKKCGLKIAMAVDEHRVLLLLVVVVVVVVAVVAATVAMVVMRGRRSTELLLLRVDRHFFSTVLSKCGRTTTPSACAAASLHQRSRHALPG